MEPSLSLDERLVLLRKIDHCSRWYSLDDKRICGICERVFSGRQIRFQKQAQIGYALRCPTEDCPADFSHWLMWSDREESTVRFPNPGVQPERGEFSFL